MNTKHQMDTNHLRWAKSHDWGEQAILQNGKIRLYDRDEERIRVFCSFEELRTWAGY